MKKRKSLPVDLIRLLGLSILRVIKRFGGGRPDTNKNSRPMDTTSFAEMSIPGPLVTDVFEHIKKMPGWSSVDDCSHFFLLLSLQSNLGITGDLIEIGSYHGRTTALLAYCLKDGEKLVVCDAFENETPDPYEN